MNENKKIKGSDQISLFILSIYKYMNSFILTKVQGILLRKLTVLGI